MLNWDEQNVSTRGISGAAGLNQPHIMLEREIPRLVFTNGASGRAFMLFQTPHHSFLYGVSATRPR